MKIKNRKENVIKRDTNYSQLGVESQIKFEINRGFVDEKEIEKIKKLNTLSVGGSMIFLNENGYVRVEFKKIQDEVFQVINQNTNGELNNPRNNPTPAGSYDQDFGMQFAATGGNSIPKKHVKSGKSFYKNMGKYL